GSAGLPVQHIPTLLAHWDDPARCATTVRCRAARWFLHHPADCSATVRATNRASSRIGTTASAPAAARVRPRLRATVRRRQKASRRDRASIPMLPADRPRRRTANSIRPAPDKLPPVWPAPPPRRAAAPVVPASVEVALRLFRERAGPPAFPAMA